MLMALSIKHPVPWHAAGNRELGDAAGNVVQYTQETLGVICLAVNAHDKMREALLTVRECLRAPDSIDVNTARSVIDTALGRMGFAMLSSILESAQASSSDLDTAIANELQRPQMAFTGSLDAAMTIIPMGWRVGWSAMPTVAAPEFSEAAQIMVVELTSPDGTRIVKASSISVPLAVCAASLMAMES
jgi:hypothetical protein